MNLHKLILLTLCIPISGCVTTTIKKEPRKTIIFTESRMKGNRKHVEIEHKMVEKIWRKAQKTVGVYAPMPEIKFKKYDEYNREIYTYVYGRGCPKYDLPFHRVHVVPEISINYEELIRNNLYYSSQELQIIIYGVISHEFFHCLYAQKTNVIMDEQEREKYGKKSQHCEMVASGHLEAVTGSIEQWLGGDGTMQRRELKITESACRQNR